MITNCESQLDHYIAKCDEMEIRIEVQEEEIRRYRKMLYDMTGLIDWQNACYSLDEYAALVKEFEPKQG